MGSGIEIRERILSIRDRAERSRGIRELKGVPVVRDMFDLADEVLKRRFQSPEELNELMKSIAGATKVIRSEEIVSPEQTRKIVDKSRTIIDWLKQNSTEVKEEFEEDGRKKIVSMREYEFEEDHILVELSEFSEGNYTSLRLYWEMPISDNEKISINFALRKEYWKDSFDLVLSSSSLDSDKDVDSFYASGIQPLEEMTPEEAFIIEALLDKVIEVKH